MSRQKNPFKTNKYELYYYCINSALAGSLVLLGALASGGLEKQAIAAALIASGVVAVAKFKEYFEGQKSEYSHLFMFVRP
jgi:hypothetical protein